MGEEFSNFQFSRMFCPIFLKDDDVKSVDYSQNPIDFDFVLSNEMIQHCFIGLIFF